MSMWDRYGKAAGAVLATAGALGVLWGALTYLDVRPVLSRDLTVIEQQVAANTQSLQLQRWQYLAEKERQGQLSPRERQEFCRLSRALGFKVRGCA